MGASTEVRCVVCEKAPAVLYCHQDDAHLCKACDTQVHSANPLASRHHRVAIKCAHVKDEQAVPEAHSVFDADPRGEAVPDADAVKELAFDDDAFFAVPDIDLPGSAADDSAAKSILGKTFVSDEFDFGEIDPLWLDRLDVGLDRLPSDILDSLVPEAPPPAKAAPKAAKPPARAASPPSELVQPPPMRAHPHMAHHAVAPVPVPHPAAMHHYAPHTMVPHHYGPPAAAEQPAAKWEAPPATPAEAPLDIDSYIPRSLLPVDPSVRVQQLRARREKLERFREKKRNRHFKKTIRYASRKAYAEVRPRIKGRFARKDEVAAMRAAGLLPAV